MEREQQRQIVEAAVLGSAEPISAQRIAGLLPRCNPSQVRTLIEKGKTRLIRGFTSRTGEKFSAQLQLDEQGETVLCSPIG